MQSTPAPPQEGRKTVGLRSVEDLVTAKEEAPARCRARTKKRKQCRSRAVPGTTRCRRHTRVVLELKQGQGQPAPTAPPEDEIGPNEAALLKTLEALGREEAIDAARNQMLRSLAKGVDLAPSKASLWAEYRQALTDFMKEADDADDSLAAAFEALRGDAEVGNS